MGFQDEMKQMFLRVAAGEIEPVEWEKWWNSNRLKLEETLNRGVGLLCNVFSEVEGFTRQIQGKGEPVEWIPCRIGMHGQNAEFDRLTGGGKWEKQGQWERQDSPHGQSVF